jgi:glycine cleavage system H protein
MSGEKYSKDHEWFRVEGGIAAVGISNHAQEQLGDVVYVELPEVGATVEAGGQAAVVESVKAASEIYSPVAGEVVEVNARLTDEPGLINESPTVDGWFFKVRIAGDLPDDVMDENAYNDFLETLD